MCIFLSSYFRTFWFCCNLILEYLNDNETNNILLVIVFATRKSRHTFCAIFWHFGAKKSMLVASKSHFFLCRKKTGEVGNRSIDDDNGVQLFRVRGIHEERFRKISNEVLANPVQFIYLFEWKCCSCCCLVLVTKKILLNKIFFVWTKTNEINNKHYLYLFFI